jgi:hypothetical protein
MARNAALPILTAEPGLTHYLEEIRRFPMLARVSVALVRRAQNPNSITSPARTFKRGYLLQCQHV